MSKTASIILAFIGDAFGLRDRGTVSNNQLNSMMANSIMPGKSTHQMAETCPSYLILLAGEPEISNANKFD
jgi:hypothetical protein